jgi:DNA primase
MFDLQDLKQQTNLQELAERDTQLKRVAATQGGEWAGPCPFCGGKDRFRVQPNHPKGGRWMCRGCSDGWQDVISYVMRRDNCDFKAACAILGGGDLPHTSERRQAPPAPAYSPPELDWQESARLAVLICQENLWKPMGAQALDYLLSRGIAEPAMRKFSLGFSPGARFERIFVPRGIVIPCIVGDEVWYLKVSYLPGDLVKCGGSVCMQTVRARESCSHCGQVTKYGGVKHNRTAAIYNADDLAGVETALFSEGEFNVMIAWQDLGEKIGIASIGGTARNRLDLATWGAYLINLQQIYCIYDSDKTGNEGFEGFQKMAPRAKRLQLPAGVKDLNDFYLAGGDLAGWFESVTDAGQEAAG